MSAYQALQRPKVFLVVAPAPGSPMLPHGHGLLRPGFISLFTVAAQRITESLLERPEPRLEMLPLVQPLAIDAQPDLLRAGSTHAALSFVKHNALRLELEPTEVQKPTDA